jgi:hypothetical protein
VNKAVADAPILVFFDGDRHADDVVLIVYNDGATVAFRGEGLWHAFPKYSEVLTVCTRGLRTGNGV